MMRRMFYRIGVLTLTLMLLSCARVLATEYPESNHPYFDNQDWTWNYEHSTVSDYLMVSFTAKTEVEDEDDYIYITDENGSKRSFTGTELAGKTIIMPGDSFSIRLRTDSSGTKYGFEIVKIVGMTNAQYEAYLKTGSFSIDINGKITGYIDHISELVIPDTVNGIRVTGIAPSGLRNCESLTSITLPSGITSIGEHAFDRCINLEKISIPDNVTNIGGYAFANCYRLSEIKLPNKLTSIEQYLLYDCDLLTVEIPDSVKSIEKCAFYRCNKLASVTIPYGVTHIGDYAFRECGNLKYIQIPQCAVGQQRFHEIFDYNLSADVVLCEGVTDIAEEAFDDCSYLNSITIPNSVKSIGRNAFHGVKNVYVKSLSSWMDIEFGNSYSNPMWKAENFYLDGELLVELTIPDDVTHIKKYAFFNFKQLECITIPDHVTDIGTAAFSYCSNLTTVTISDGVESIGVDAFSDCDKLTTVTIPDSVKSVGKGAFLSCDELKEIKVPQCVVNGEIKFKDVFSSNAYVSVELSDSVTVIGEGAFAGSSIKNVHIPKSVTIIGKEAFKQCSIISISIPDGVTSIGDSAFSKCDNLTSVTIPGNIKRIGDSAFYRCTNVTSIKIAGSVTEIGDHAFDWCINATTIMIAEGVTKIGDYAFYNCRNVTSITIPGSVREIGREAFRDCDEATSIMMAEGVTKIGDGAFYHCDKATSIMIPESVTAIGDYAFDTCINVTSITIPGSVTEIGDHAFDWCKNATTIMIAEGVTKIGDYAFYNCNNVTTIMIPESVTQIGDWAFSECDSLKKVFFSGMSTTMGANVFSYKSKLTIYCYEYSDIDFWAADNGYKCVYMDSAVPMEIKLPVAESVLLDDNVDLSMYVVPPSSVNTIKWTSSAPEIVSVENGVITAHTAGVANITASYGSISDKVTVTAYGVISMPDDCRLSLDETIKLDITTTPKCSLSDIKWSSSAPDIVSVEDGEITALGTGKATITATWRNVTKSIIVTAYCELTDYSLSPAEVWVVSKENAQIVIVDKIHEQANPVFTWSSLDTNIAEVSSTGLVTGKRIGETTIKVTTDNGLTRECVVHVCYPVTTIEYKYDKITIPLNSVVSLTANVTSGQNILENKLVTFTSSDPSIASVDLDGKVTGHKAGTVIITAEAANGINARCEVSVSTSEECTHFAVVVYKAVAATCTKTGLTEGSYCSVCGKVLVAQTEIPANGHTEETVPGKAATCTEPGLTDGVKCSVCDETITVQIEIPANGHTEETVPGKAATCTEPGLTDGVKCSVCGEAIIAQTEIPATGHDAGEWVVVTEETTEMEGLKELRCTVCGFVLETKIIPIVDTRLAGDINSDGVVDGRDLLRLARFIGGFDVDINEANSSVNGDDVIDGRDLLRLARFIGGYSVVLE